MSLQTGKIGENYANSFLLASGYHLITQNYYTRYGELDIVAYKNGITVFIEVKTRKTDAFGMPEDAITKTKRLHMRRAAMHYMVRRRYVKLWQFDVIAILLNSFDEVRDLRHYRDVQI